MPPPLEVIQQWLVKVTFQYQSAEIVTRDVLNAISQFPTLSTRTEAYTSDSGHTQLLLQLHGTLPIGFRSATYYIPLIVWYPTDYPRQPPLVYVTPTRDMAIRTSEDVAPDGRVVGPLMERWARKWEAQSMRGLLESLQSVFSAQPPVYSRAATATPPAPTPGPVASTSAVGHVPPVPVRPRDLAHGPRASPIMSSGQTVEQLPAYRPPPPASPSTARSFQAGPRQSSLPIPSSSSTPPPVTRPPTWTPPPQPRPAPRPPTADLLDEHAHSDPPPADLMDDRQDAMQSSATGGPDNRNGSAQGNHPPRRPLPPSTLHLHSLVHNHLSTSLGTLTDHLTHQTASLRSLSADLASGEPAIRDEMARLEAVKAVCEGVGARLDEVVAQGESRCRELEKRGQVGVDEIVCGVSIVHNQLIDLVAEDNAIEDTIYHLARALDAERIDLTAFLKHTRILAREQFQKRALIEKIRAMLELGGRAGQNGGVEGPV